MPRDRFGGDWDEEEEEEVGEEVESLMYRTAVEEVAPATDLQEERRRRISLFARQQTSAAAEQCGVMAPRAAASSLPSLPAPARAQRAAMTNVPQGNLRMVVRSPRKVTSAMEVPSSNLRAVARSPGKAARRAGSAPQGLEVGARYTRQESVAGAAPAGRLVGRGEELFMERMRLANMDEKGNEFGGANKRGGAGSQGLGRGRRESEVVENRREGEVAGRRRESGVVERRSTVHPVAPGCGRCGGAVWAAEMVRAAGLVWHR